MFIKQETTEVCDPTKKVEFVDAIKELSEVFDTDHNGSRVIVSALHRARQARNKLAHDFFGDYSELRYFFSEGGIAKKHDELRRYERMFFPLCGLIQVLSDGYSLDIYSWATKQPPGKATPQIVEQEFFKKFQKPEGIPCDGNGSLDPQKAVNDLLKELSDLKKEEEGNGIRWD